MRNRKRIKKLKTEIAVQAASIVDLSRNVTDLTKNITEIACSVSNVCAATTEFKHHFEDQLEQVRKAQLPAPMATQALVGCISTDLPGYHW